MLSSSAAVCWAALQRGISAAGNCISRFWRREYQIADLPRLKLVAAMMGKDFDDLQSIKSKEDEAVSDELEIEARA